MSRRLIFLLLIVLWIAPAALNAQAVAWEVVVAAQVGVDWNIYHITPAGVQAPLPLPAGMIVSTNISDMIVSPNLRYVVATQTSEDYTISYPPRIADLKTGTFYELALPIDRPIDYTLSEFDPTGTRFAVSVMTENMGADFPYEGRFGVVDVTTGAYTDHTAQVSATGLSGGFDGWYMLGDWDAGGIQMHINCYACEPPFEGEYSAWNPDTGAFTPDTGAIFSAFAVQLPLTGEMFTQAFSMDYPFNPGPSAYFPYPNVLVYKPSAAYLPTFSGDTGEYVYDPNTSIIYNNPNVLDLTTARFFTWAADGQYILVDMDDQWTLLNRAGGAATINAPFHAPEVIGTRDGFLALQDNADQIIVHHFTVPDMQDHALGTLAIGGRLRVLAATALGASAAPVPAAFTPIPADFATLEAVMLTNQPPCPGFMPSILFSGQQGQVTPGSPNNIRFSPTTTSEIVGRIPGEAIFDILFGPVCAENTAWWYVQYAGVTGYMAEGMGGTYFAELVRR